MSVVKSNAYGHGFDLVARTIENETDWFAAVNLSEALRLRKIGIKKPILVVSYYNLEQVLEAVRKNISLVVYDLKQAKAIDKAAAKLGKRAKVHLKIDIGTSRLGVTVDNAMEFAHEVKNFKNISIQGVFSHLAASEEDSKFTIQQLRLFDEAVWELKQIGISPKIVHIACTASTLVFERSHNAAIRLGIGLYGLWPRPKLKTIQLKPALSWKTRIIQIKELKAGTFVGYGHTYKTQRKTLLAVLPVGYYEGYDRRLSNVGSVLIRGKRCKVLGRVCMNLIMVDVTGLKKAEVGDEAVLIGRQGVEEITADELASKIGTINYEVVSRINPETPRIYA